MFHNIAIRTWITWENTKDKGLSPNATVNAMEKKNIL
jgi:hypothetical protein